MTNMKMKIIRNVQFMPSIKTDDEKRSFFDAILYVDLYEVSTTANDLAPTPDEQEEEESARFPDSTLTPGQIQQSIEWKTIRFFSEVFRVMAEGVGSERDVVAFARNKLMRNEEDVGRVASCALHMPLCLVEKVVADILRSRREVLRTRELAEADGWTFEQRRGPGPCMVDGEDMLEQRDSEIFHRRIDRFLELEGARDRVIRDLERMEGGVGIADDYAGDNYARNA
ncbi:uncharacterized protein B0H64DRAFT_403678 [Chaetomium fimeti]|uniref:Uncharacterized protein n=1 Tax=Chaetomium fimeti TaxID=1854472 RepID=A0AAE0LPX8_9PEZI|nr:hypothetical protein B0H64DRAFT_403678 [Chaetomium fimeti]